MNILAGCVNEELSESSLMSVYLGMSINLNKGLTNKFM